MKKFIFPLLLLALTTTAQAQTKRIAHRSHSGSAKSFNIKGDDNFGLPSNYENKYKTVEVKKDTSTTKGTDTTKKKKPTQPAVKPKTEAPKSKKAAKAAKTK